MLMTTTDTIPQPYLVLGVVVTAARGVNPAKAAWSVKSQTQDIALHARAALRDLEAEAVRMGADAVIGIRYSNVFGNSNLVTGTAIRFEYANATPIDAK